MFEPAAEAMPVRQRRELQTTRLRAQVARLRDANDFYRRQLADVPSDLDIDDLAAIPFVAKPDLWAQYPLGTLAVPREQVRRVHATSGTSGRPTVVSYTAGDLDVFRAVNARALAGAGAGPGTWVHTAYGYGLFTGGMGLQGGCEALGAAVVPISGGGTARQVQLITDLRPEVLLCTPSYAATLADGLTAAGVAPGENSLRVGIFGAEPWSESMRAQLAERLGITALDIYGLCEVIGPGVAFESLGSAGRLHINEDHFYVECVDPDGAPLPDGEVGELVFTTLTREAAPVLRYRTGDLASISRQGCDGRTLTTMSRILGRRDDMLVIRGVNVFPSEVEAVVLADERVATAYALVLDERGGMPDLIVVAEPTDPGDRDALGDTLGRGLKERLGITCRVVLAEPGQIPRVEMGKAVRVHRLTAKTNPLPEILADLPAPRS
ncbi:phenylacetate--CoA ligase [soil metagenome]